MIWICASAVYLCSFALFDAYGRHWYGWTITFALAALAAAAAYYETLQLDRLART